MTTDQWSLKGDYFENCNCEILCPCVIPGSSGTPTEGHCDVAFAFHVSQGEFNGVPLDGLNLVVVAYTPGNMGAGDWTMAAYIDQRANPAQREALARIVSGEAGGPLERWTRLTTNFLGVKPCAITYLADGHSRRVQIPDIIDFNVDGILARGQESPMQLENTGHPVSSTLAMARGTGSTYTDHGMTWDNTGKNGHYAPFDWTGP